MAKISHFGNKKKGNADSPTLIFFKGSHPVGLGVEEARALIENGQ